MLVIVIIAAVFATVSVALFVLELRRYRKRKQRSQFVRSMIEKSDVDGFLEEIERDIAKTSDDAYLRLLLVNKSTGLFYKGEWANVMSLLESVEPFLLPREFKTLYYNNLLSSMLLLDRIDAANELYAKHLASLAPYTVNRELNIAVGSTLGALEYYNGNISASKAKFTQLLEVVRPLIHTAVTHYFLGLISISEENRPQAIEHFEKAWVMGKNTWVTDCVRPHLESLKQSAT